MIDFCQSNGYKIATQKFEAQSTFMGSFILLQLSLWQDQQRGLAEVCPVSAHREEKVMLDPLLI